MKYVGLDLSYSSTGFVMLDGENIVSHAFKAGKPNWPFHERANDLWKALKHALPAPDDCKICIEGAAYAAEFNAFMLGELSGAIRMLLYLNGYKYELIQPTTVKKFATGTGNAQKHFVAAHVAKKWDFTHRSNDVVDAFVLAKICEFGPENIEIVKARKSKDA